MSRPYIGDADANYVRMSLEDFGNVATILKAAGFDIAPGRRNGRGPTRLYRLTTKHEAGNLEHDEREIATNQIRLDVLNELAARYRAKGYRVPGILNDFIAELERR